MYPRQQISYSAYPPSNQAYPAVYYAQPVYQYHNYPGKMGPISYTPDNAAIMATTANTPSVTAQIPQQSDNLYINYQQPQQQMLSQQSLAQQQLPQQQLPPQHIHQQQLQQQQQRQYELSHQIGQLQQVVKTRPMVDQYIGQSNKNKPKSSYQTQMSPSPQITQVPKQMIQQAQPRNPMQPIMLSQQQQIVQSQRQYNPLPQKPPIIQQPIELQQVGQPYKLKQDDSTSSLGYKMSFAIQDSEPPGCFDIIGRGNLPSIFFNTSISFS